MFTATGDSARFVLAAAAMILVAACVTGSSSPTTTTTTPPPEPEPVAAPAPVETAHVEPVEAGFNHCCGNDSYRIEITCNGMIKRCYTNETGVWKQTYGRHCLSELGRACYLEECDAHCQ